MLGFIDESGDTGFRFDRGSSGFFIVSMIIFEREEEVAKADKCIEELKISLRKPSMEFHFTKTNDDHRQKLFDAVKECDFRVFALVVDKRQLEKINHEDFLLTSFVRTMEEAKTRGLLSGANLKFDETGGNAFKKKLASSLLARVNEHRKECIKQFSPLGSSGSNMIQLADMVCGAIARPHNSPGHKKSDYLTLLKHRITEDSVLVWPY